MGPDCKLQINAVGQSYEEDSIKLYATHMKNTALSWHAGPSEKDQEKESFGGKTANKPLKSGPNAVPKDSSFAMSEQD